MNTVSALAISMFLSSALALAAPSAHAGRDNTLPSGFQEASQPVGDGMTIHYVRGGSGDPLILVHGFAETAQMWRPMLTTLGRQYTVITPDLPGFEGSSTMPDGKYDMKTVARYLHELVKHLGFTKIRLVGHDIGLMAVYAYAAEYPDEVQKLVLMDAPIPGVGDIWDQLYNNPALWHFHFAFSPIALKLVQGRERTFLDHFWISFSADPNNIAIPESEREAFAKAYAKKGAMEAGLGYFKGFPQDAEDNKAFVAAGKLPMPVLTIAGEKSMGDALGAQANLAATDVHSVVLKGAGHWITEERLQDVQSAIVDFLHD